MNLEDSGRELHLVQCDALSYNQLQRTKPTTRIQHTRFSKPTGSKRCVFLTVSLAPYHYPAPVKNPELESSIIKVVQDICFQDSYDIRL